MTQQNCNQNWVELRKEDLSGVVVLTVDGYFVGKFSLRFKVKIEFCMTDMNRCFFEVTLVFEI